MTDPVLTSTGIVLDFKNKEAINATNYATQKGQENIRVAMATFPGGQRFYVVLLANEVIFEAKSLDEIGGFIDKLQLTGGIK